MSTVAGVRFESVRKGKGKTHLAVPGRVDAPVETLCGKEFAAGGYEVVEQAADCQPCLRRRDDPAVVSSAFFAHGAGTELLELSLAEARKRSAERPATAAKPSQRPAAPPKPAAPPPPPERVETEAGVVLETPRGRLEAARFEGNARLRRVAADRFRLTLGDAEIDLAAEAGEIKASFRTTRHTR